MAKVKEENGSGKVKMYRVLLSKNKLDHPDLIFGKPFDYTKNGDAVVEVPEGSLKNELKRPSPLLTQKQYEAYLETVSLSEDVE
jgi:hypothetical protein